MTAIYGNTFKPAKHYVKNVLGIWNSYLHFVLLMQQIGYKLNLRTRVCEKFVLSEPWVPYEVPANTTLDYTYYLGSAGVAGNSVEMNFFSGDTERGKNIIEIASLCFMLCSFQVTTGVCGLLTVVFPMCTPISQHILQAVTIVPRMAQKTRIVPLCLYAQVL